MTKYPVELIEEFSRNNVVLFVGSGLSIGAGLAGWSDLVRPLAQAAKATWPANPSDLSSSHLLDAAQHYEYQYGTHALITHIRRALGDVHVEPTKVHKLLTHLPIFTVFTTNYDSLIERAYLDAGRSVNVIVETTELAFWSNSSVQIVKLCGDLNRPKSIVITARDFNTYFSKKSGLADRLRSSLEISTPLFLGYSLRDPFFNQIWDRIGVDFGSLRRRGYAVLFEPTLLEIEDLERRQIEPIVLRASRRDWTQTMAHWLEKILERLP